MRNIISKFFFTLLVLTMGIGQVWGISSPATNPATTTRNSQSFLNVADTWSNARIKNADSTLAYSVGYIKQTLNPAWYEGGKSNSSFTYSNAEDEGFIASSGTGGANGNGYYSIKSSQTAVIYATGFKNLGVMGSDNSSSKYIIVEVEEYSTNGTTSNKVSFSSANKGTSITTYNNNFTPTNFYKITVTSNSTSGSKLYQVRFIRPSAPSSLVASEITSAGATLTVTDAENINNYEFYISEDNTAPTASSTATHSVSNGKVKVIDDLSASTTYYAWVRSNCNGGKTAWKALTGSSFETSGSGCAATAPGNLSMSDPSAGVVTLTAAGSAASGDTWYWQTAAAGEDDTDEYDAVNGKAVNAAGTYYLRSYNATGTCWSTAKSIEVTAADLLTAITPSLSYATSTLVLTALTTTSPTLTGNDGNGSVSYALNNVNPAGCMTIDAGTGVVTAVAAGTATVTATIAANGYYAGGEATSGTIKVVAAPAGMIDQKLATGSVAWDASVIVTEDYTNVSGLTALSQHGSATASGNGNTSNGGQTSKVGTATGDFNGNNYLELSFTIADGKEFNITSIAIPVQPVTSDANNFKAVLSDNQGSTEIVGTTTNQGNGTLANIGFSSYGTLKGTITLRIYAWGWSNGYRLGKNIVIDGTIVDEGSTPSGYTVTYAGTKDEGSFPVDATVYESSDQVTVKGNTGGLTRTISGAPATFLGWSTNENMYGGTHYKAGDKFEITANTTLYAIWGFNITYIDEDKSTEITGLEPTYYIYGEGATLPTNPTAPTGYTFGGWYNAWCVDESSTSSSPCGENAPCGFDDTHCLTTEIGTADTWDAEYYAKWILSAPTYEVTFNMNDHGTAPTKQDVVENGKVTKPADPAAIGYEFGGWYKEAGCANAWDFNTDVVTEATVLYAKWTAFTGCTELWPATSGDAPTAEGDEINMQTGSTGATMTVLAKANKLAYTSAGLQFGSESGVKVNVVLNNEIVVGTRISMTLVAGGEKTRGLFLYDANGNKINAFTCWVDGTNAASNGAEETFTYTVVANDGLAGTNEFQLWRNNTVYLKSLKVSNCGDAIIYHNLTSEVNIAGKGTVTLGASSVREGLTTTAEYSAIDEAYEFVNWTVSGEGASIADATANPATITMGTGDAVVTLNLQLKPVYYTVTYKDGESSMGTEEVAENGHPTATGITTAKKGYNFLGWSETNGGAVVELSTITITAATNIYAKYEAIPCPTYGTVFSMNVTDPADTEYNENNEFSLEIGATYTGGKAYSGGKSTTKRVGVIDANGEYSFANNGDVTVKVDLDCALQEGDVLSFTSTPSRELKIQKVAGTDLYTTSGKTFTIPAASPLIGEYEFYLMRGNSESTFKTFNIYRPAVLTGVTLDDAVVAIGGIVTPTMTLAPVADAYVSSQVWSIEGAGAGTIANIDPSTGEVTGVALGSVTVKVVLNGSIENTCTVTVIESYTQLDVTETSEWNFAGAAAASSKKSFPNTTEEFLLANISGVNNTPEFNARALVVKGKYVSNSQLQAQTIRFNVATSGKLTIRYACTSDKGEGNNRELYINGVPTGSMTSNGEVTYTQVVPGGEVTIKALYDKESVLTEDIMNYKYIKFDVNPDVSDADYIRATTQGRYGTICLPNGGVMVGADLFEVAYYGATSQKIFFDQIMNGEMEAGIPYIFLPKEGVSQLGVYYTDAAGSTAGNRNGLYGSYTTEVLTQNDGNYVLYNNQYLYVGDESTNVKVGANRAYIKLAEITPIEPALAPGRRRVSMGVIGAPQVTTGVGELNADETPIKVMIDGQLYIIRGEKMYDATGRLVK